MFLKKKAKVAIDLNNLPNHIAFICDGNRRWAKERGLPTLLGHKEGLNALKRVVKRAVELKLKYLTFFCFSTENFDRSKEEVKYLFDLFRDIKNLVPDFIRDGYKFHHAGDISLLPPDLVTIINEVTEKTSGGKNGTICIALAYGGRNDIVRAAQRLLKEMVDPDEITEESFKNYLSTGDMPDVDLLVRTSGEQRISGFLLYNMPYAELYFVKKHWPAFRAKDLDNCIIEFQSRTRRFGK